MKRSLQFEALESRITMTTGLAHPAVAGLAAGLGPIKGDGAAPMALVTHKPPAGMATAVIDRDVHVAAASPPPIKGTLSGGQSSIIPGTDTVVMGGFSGKLGKAPMQATIYGQVSGNTFEGGSMHLFNTRGEIIANLGSGTLKKSGKNDAVTVEFEFEQGTKAYAQVAGSAGTATIELEPGTSKAKPAAADLAQSQVWDAKTEKLLLDLDSDPESLIRLLTELFLKATGG